MTIRFRAPVVGLVLVAALALGTAGPARALDAVSPARAATTTDDPLATVLAALADSATASTAATTAAQGFTAVYADVVSGSVGSRQTTRADLTAGALRVTDKTPGVSEYGDTYTFAGTATTTGGPISRVQYLQKTLRTIAGWVKRPKLHYVRIPRTLTVDAVDAQAAAYGPGPKLSYFLSTHTFSQPTTTVSGSTTVYRLYETGFNPHSWYEFTVSTDDGRLLKLSVTAAGQSTPRQTWTYTYARPTIAFPSSRTWITLTTWRTARAALTLGTRVPSFARATRTDALALAAAADRTVTVADLRTAATGVLANDTSAAERPLLHTTNIKHGVKIVGRNPFTKRLTLRYVRLTKGRIVISKH